MVVGGGGVEEENFERKILLIHVSTRVHTKIRQTCNSFSLLPFQEDCLLFFVLFYYSLLFLKFEGGGGNPCNPPPSRSANVLKYNKITTKSAIYLIIVSSSREECLIHRHSPSKFEKKLTYTI